MRGDAVEVFSFPRNQLKAEGWWLMPSEERRIFHRLRSFNGQRLVDLTASASGGFAGYQTSADPVLVFDEVEDCGQTLKLLPRHEPKHCGCGKDPVEIERAALKPFLFGKDVGRWLIDWKKTWVMFPYDVYQKKETLYDELSVVEDWNLIPSIHNIDKFNFAKYPNLEVLAKYEAAKKRAVDEPPPHVKLMKKLAIADYEPASDAGNMRFYPNGRLMKSLIERYVTDKVMEYGGFEVETPIMYDSHHPSMESYFHRFPARQYSIDSEGKHLFLRFAACFGQFLMAKDFQLSYKNLPLKLYELTRYSFRREQSGELVGLRRLRAFTMPDCHAMCKDMDQAKEEFRKRFELSRDVIKGLGIEDTDYEMAIRFTEEFYNENKALIEELVVKLGKPVLVEMWEERFFYFVLKWEFNYVDSSGKASALSTDQIDVENGKRYNIDFTDDQNKLQNPIILHNSPSGAIERVIYTLLEKSAKDQREGRKPMFPLWLAPTQVRLIPVKPEFLDHCEKLADTLTENNIRVDVDDRNESVGKSIRDAETEWIRFIIVIGEKEVNSSTLVIRDRKSKDPRNLSVEEFMAEIKEETKGKPFMRVNMGRSVAKRPQIMV